MYGTDMVSTSDKSRDFQKNPTGKDPMRGGRMTGGTTQKGPLIRDIGSILGVRNQAGTHVWGGGGSVAAWACGAHLNERKTRKKGLQKKGGSRISGVKKNEEARGDARER